MKKKKTIVNFPLKFSWKKSENRIDSSTILINGILTTCILLSIASGFIDLTFFSGLSKSLFHVGTIPIAAAVLYTVISIGFISGKFWCAMHIGMIRELQTRLEAKNKPWASNLRKARIPWQIAHKFLVSISIITALSLSVNSIGAGIRTMEQNINNMQFDANELINLQKSLRTGNTDIKDAKRSNISSALTAQQSVVASFDEKWKYVIEYRQRRDNLQAEFESADEDRQKEINTELVRIKRDFANRAPEGVTTNNIDYVEEYRIKNQLLAQAKQFEVVDSSSYIKEGIAYDEEQIQSYIKALADKEYKTPDNEIIKFVNEDGTLVDVQLAISRLQHGIAKWQSDTGDVGESSKIFTLIATYMNADPKAGGMGASEWMMMVLIALFGIVQEFLIYLFTPKATIDRKLLSQVSHYLKWENEEEKERFLLSVYISYVGDGIINQEQFELKCKKAVYFMELTENDIVQKYSSKELKLPNLITTQQKNTAFSSKVDATVKEIDGILKEI